MAQIEGLDVNFHILNEDVSTLDVELRYLQFEKYEKNAVFPIKEKCL